MGSAESLLLGLIITLSLGAYGYTYMSWRDLRKEIRALWVRLANHYEHRMLEVETRLSGLEARELKREAPPADRRGASLEG